MRAAFAILLVAVALGARPLPEALRDRLDGLAASKPQSRAAVQATTLALGAPGAAAADRAAWFDEIRRRAAAERDPELKAFLESQLQLDPAVPASAVRAPAPAAASPYAPGKDSRAALADARRAIELGESPALVPAALANLAADRADAELADDALVLLRRVDPAASAPLLWQRLGSSRARSAALRWEEEIERLPLAVVGRGFPSRAPEGWSKPARAAWLRLVAIRPGLSADKAAVLGLLKGPADELTEAAWDAVPNVFAAADRAALEAAARDLSPRLAPRAKEALARLR